MAIPIITGWIFESLRDEHRPRQGNRKERKEAGHLAQPKADWGQTWPSLALSWAQQEPTWAQLGRNLRRTRASWLHLGPNLSPTGDQHGATWARLDASWA